MGKNALLGAGTMCVCALLLQARALGAAGSTLPAGWTSQDIGAVGLSGSASFADGVYTLRGAGADIWGSADAFQAVLQPAAGDVQIVARVTALQNTNAFAKAGLVLRGGTAAGSANVILDVRPNGSVEFMDRPADGAATSYLAGSTQALPAWLKLGRSGSVVTGSVSADGVAWTAIGSTTIAFGPSIVAGLAVTSHDTTQIATATFDTVSLVSDVPAPWVSQDIGAVGVTGSASAVNGIFTVRGAGGDIWGMADAFHAVEQPVTGDVQVAARVTALQNTNAFAKAGVMLRSDASAGSANVVLDVLPSGAIEFMARAASGAATSYLAGATQATPVWLKLTRSGPLVTGFASSDGVSWSMVGSTVGVSLGNAMLAGLVVTSHDVTQTATAAFDQAGTSPLPSAPSPPTGLKIAPPGTGPVTPLLAPTAYAALSDRVAYPKPALPALGAAGYAFDDPTFGSRILRVTDANTRPGLVNRSFRVPSNAHLAAWNATSTAFFVISNDGTVIPYSFDPAAMTAARMQPSSSGDGGLTLAFYVEPQFSLSDPQLIFGVRSGGNMRTIQQYDFRSGAYSTIVDLDSLVSGLTNTYVGGVMTGGTTSENLLTFFGGGSQDQHYYALWQPLASPASRKLVNTLVSTINGAATATPLNFHLHATGIDRSGRYVFLFPTAVDLAAPRSAAQVYIWDTSTDAITPVTSAMHPSGHDAAGFGIWVNQDCCTSSAWDAAQWQVRSLDAPAITSDVIAPVALPKEVFLADHTSWNNARSDAATPVISSTYRYGTNTVAWRAWDDEIIGIDMRNGGGGTVWRFAHHRSAIGSDADPTVPYFWYEPIPNVSPDGRWVLFTSNWEKTLGADAAEHTARQDVFIVRLRPQS